MDMNNYWDSVFAKLDAMSQADVVDLLCKAGFDLSGNVYIDAEVYPVKAACSRPGQYFMVGSGFNAEMKYSASCGSYSLKMSGSLGKTTSYNGITPSPQVQVIDGNLAEAA